MFALISSSIIGDAICSTFRKEVVKIELLVDHILGLLKLSSTFAEDYRQTNIPYGVGFFYFSTCKLSSYTHSKKWSAQNAKLIIPMMQDSAMSAAENWNSSARIAAKQIHQTASFAMHAATV